LKCLSSNDVPPQNNGLQNVKIGISLRVIKVLDINPDSGDMDTVIWLDLFWHDPRLLYDGEAVFEDWDSTTRYINFEAGPNGDIWTPDIIIENGNYSNYDEVSNTVLKASVYDSKFQLYHGWNVSWRRTLRINTTCKVDFSMFPYDIQYCPIILKPWTFEYRTNIISLYVGKPYPFYFNQLESNHKGQFSVDEKFFKMFNERLIVDNREIQGAQMPLGIDAERVAYVLKVKRNPLYYNLCIIWPLIIMMLFAYLNFWLPFNMYDRISLTVMELLTVYSIMEISSARRPSYRYSTWLEEFISGATIICIFPAFETILVTSLVEIVSTTKDKDSNVQSWKDPICSHEIIKAFVEYIERCSAADNTPITLVPNNKKTGFEEFEWKQIRQVFIQNKKSNRVLLAQSPVALPKTIGSNTVGHSNNWNSFDGNKSSSFKKKMKKDTFNRNGWDLFRDSYLSSHRKRCSTFCLGHGVIFKERFSWNDQSRTYNWCEVVDQAFCVAYPGVVIGLLAERFSYLILYDGEIFSELYIGPESSSNLTFAAASSVSFAILWTLALHNYFYSIAFDWTGLQNSWEFKSDENVSDDDWLQWVFSRLYIDEATALINSARRSRSS